MAIEDESVEDLRQRLKAIEAAEEAGTLTDEQAEDEDKIRDRLSEIDPEYDEDDDDFDDDDEDEED